MQIDRQRIAAVRALEALGFTYRNGTWLPAVAAPSQALPLLAEADAMHAAVVRRADVLTGCLDRGRARGLRGRALARWQGARRKRVGSQRKVAAGEAGEV
jgi:hypothetical protein